MSDAAQFPITDAVLEALAVTRRGVNELLPEAEWTKKLARSAATGVPLRIKLGLDPTAPDIHVGHTVVLNKMRQLQDLGHEVIFLIGVDFKGSMVLNSALPFAWNRPGRDCPSDNPGMPARDRSSETSASASNSVEKR